jgi:hypothetical protein
MRSAAEIVLGVDGFGGGDAEVEDEQRHGDGEDAVAEGGDAFHALTGNTVVEGVHPTKFSIGGSAWLAEKGIREPQRTQGTHKERDQTRGSPRFPSASLRAGSRCAGTLARLDNEGQIRSRKAAEFAESAVRGMRQRALVARDRACGALVMVCLLVVMAREWGARQRAGTESGAGAEQPCEHPDRRRRKSFRMRRESKKKDQSENPVQFVDRHKTKRELLRARDWESGWIAGEYVGRNRTLVTPTREQREVIYLRETLTTPEAYMKRMFAAGVDQVRGTPYQWDDGWGGYAERFASREGQFIAANSLAALGNAKLGYEVRYDQCKCQGLWPRTRHAFIRNLVTYDRSEEHLHPQWALYGGAFGGGMISTAWKPGRRMRLTKGGQAAAEQVGWGTLLNFVTEFSWEINRKQGVK